MTHPHPDDRAACFAPRAARPMAEMFDDVSGRYDLLNRVMSLGRDRSWREAMWRAVPESARVVMDLCTGSGTSLEGLRRPGRLLIGTDVSLEMLGIAAANANPLGWAPRLVCADAFSLPFRDGSLDAVTVAFGIRNLRPREESLHEIARVLAPGGTLAVLEAAAPAPGPFAPFHRLYLRKLVPLAGRISDDPAAYRYLADSILEFGAGPEFERDLERARFVIVSRRAFLLGATRLWVARRGSGDGQFASVSPGRLQDATSDDRRAGGRSSVEAERRVWTGVQALVAAALAFGLAAAAVTYGKWNAGLPLAGWRRPLVWFLIAGAVVFFAFRSASLVARWREMRSRN
jgi:demethylmenaquinone methyltransferase / 2-methoxy-6-polyprenyl-1,4-benzoquinol methylase